VLPRQVEDKLAALPTTPGVYLFKDEGGVVVYVGKAKSLRARVRSYFHASTSDTRYFVPLLHGVVADLETLVTQSEKEAAILENLLIKQHRPRFNIKLRDDKEYPSLRLEPRAEWPRLTVVRTPAADGARYFGPYHSATAARRTLHLVNKHFQLRTCTDADLGSRRRPCLQHQIKRCPAPCVFEVDRAFYAEQVRAVALFLEGRHDELSSELQQRMGEAAAAMSFELAAVYRDQLHAISKVREEQRVVTVERGARDVLGLYREGDLVELALLHVRDGKLAGVATFSVRGAEVPDEEVVAAFLSQHYSRHDRRDAVAPKVRRPEGAREPEIAEASAVPEEILVGALPDAAEGIADWLGERAGKAVRLHHPQRGPKAALLALADENARHAFAEKRRASDDVSERLAQLQKRLRLPQLPRRIECCDISHLGGGDTVGAVVAMADGEPDKARYRTYHVRTVGAASGGAGALGDDYGAMYEVLARRFRRGLAARGRSAEPVEPSEATEPAEPGEVHEGAGAWDLPDLFVVDGGRGQLAVALSAARDLGLHDLPIVALAKEKENVLGDTLVDRVYLPGQKNPIALRSHSGSLFFLARLRDEAHRFSNRGREKLGTSRRMRGALDGVRGLGKTTSAALLRGLGTLSAVRAASDEELLAVPGVNRRHVAALRAHFRGEPSPEPTELKK